MYRFRYQTSSSKGEKGSYRASSAWWLKVAVSQLISAVLIKTLLRKKKKEWWNTSLEIDVELIFMSQCHVDFKKEIL